MKKNNKRIVTTAILTIIIVVCTVLYLVFGRGESIVVSFNTEGGSEISEIKVRVGKKIKIPEEPTKDGYEFLGWINNDGYIVTKNTKVTENITLSAFWVKKGTERITEKFDTDGGNKIDDIINGKGSVILLPINPTKKGYIFAGWMNQNGEMVTKGVIVSNDTTLKALWIEEGTDLVEITFNSEGGNSVENIIVEKGKNIKLPVAPIRDGYKFAGWVDEANNLVTTSTTITKNTSLKAIWKALYVCPENCTPDVNGKTCAQIENVPATKSAACQDDYTLVGNECIDIKTKQKDETREVYSCPSDYILEGNICKKIHSVDCTPIN